jgi:hypothetical protein
MSLVEPSSHWLGAELGGPHAYILRSRMRRHRIEKLPQLAGEFLDHMIGKLPREFNREPTMPNLAWCVFFLTIFAGCLAAGLACFGGSTELQAEMFRTSQWVFGAGVMALIALLGTWQK